MGLPGGEHLMGQLSFEYTIGDMRTAGIRTQRHRRDAAKRETVLKALVAEAVEYRRLCKGRRGRSAEAREQRKRLEAVLALSERLHR